MRRVIFLLTVSGAGLAVLLGLGIWQLQRMAWKEGILATIEARIAKETSALPAEPSPETDKYWPVSVTGYVGNRYLRVLVSSKARGASYRIISPFEVDGRYVLLDRGVAPVDEEPPAGHVEKVEVIGNLHWPDEVDRYTPAPDLKQNIWYARDVDAMAKVLGTEPLLIVLREQSFYDTPVRPDPVSTVGIPNNHLQYAITWFSLAFIWAAMTLYFLRRSRP